LSLLLDVTKICLTLILTTHTQAYIYNIHTILLALQLIIVHIKNVMSLVLFLHDIKTTLQIHHKITRPNKKMVINVVIRFCCVCDSFRHMNNLPIWYVNKTLYLYIKFMHFYPINIVLCCYLDSSLTHSKIRKKYIFSSDCHEKGI